MTTTSISSVDFISLKNFSGDLNDAAADLRGDRPVHEDVLAGRVDDQRAVVVDHGRVEVQQVVERHDASGRPGGGEDDLHAGLLAGCPQDGGGRLRYLLAGVQQRAVQVDGDHVDFHGIFPVLFQ